VSEIEGQIRKRERSRWIHVYYLLISTAILFISLSLAFAVDANFQWVALAPFVVILFECIILTDSSEKIKELRKTRDDQRNRIQQQGTRLENLKTLFKEIHHVQVEVIAGLLRLTKEETINELNMLAKAGYFKIEKDAIIVEDGEIEKFIRGLEQQFADWSASEKQIAGNKI